MYKRPFSWQSALIALATVALLTAGLGIIVYIGLARERLLPTPTPRPGSPKVVRPSLLSPSETPEPLATVVGVVQDYSPGALIIVISPIEGNVTQIIVPENLTVIWADGKRASPKDIAPGQTLFAEGPIDAIGRMIASQITIVREAKQPTPSPSPEPSATWLPLTPTITPSLAAQGWLGEYFANSSLAGSPVMTRTDGVIDFQWRQGSPDPTVPADRFSVRWRRRWLFEGGSYRFFAYSDDGVRLWVDGILVIDQWRDQPATLTYGDLNLSAGEHEVRVEYYEALDSAEIRVWWEQQGLYPDWRGEYFANPDLAGKPVLVRNDTEIAFNWGSGSPAPEVPTDRFSVRWTRTATFEEGAYRFNIRVDDGVRLWVDGLLLVDEWHPSAAMTYQGYLWLPAGPHALRVEYFEAGGGALVYFEWERLHKFVGWKGEYFANPVLVGRPVFVRDDDSINFDWQTGSPGSGLPIDNFSARWSRTVDFDEGGYIFWAVADDGVRVYLDGQLLIDEWHDAPGTHYQRQLYLAKGAHALIVEYYEHGGKALIRFGWEALGTATPTPTSTLTFTPSPTPLTPSLTPTPSLTWTPLPPTWTPIPPTATRLPSKTPVSPTVTPSYTPLTPTPTLEPTSTETPALTPTLEVSPSAAISATATGMPELTPSVTQTLGPSSVGKS